MPADDCPFERAFPGRVANRIVNEVGGISLVSHDIPSKPPLTMLLSQRH